MRISRTSRPDELERRVDEVLFYVWDPIGVANEPLARAEYESYVPQVLELLVTSDNPQPIADCLASVIKDRMGLSPIFKQSKYAAELLQKHKKAIKEGCA